MSRFQFFHNPIYLTGKKEFFLARIVKFLANVLPDHCPEG